MKQRFDLETQIKTHLDWRHTWVIIKLKDQIFLGKVFKMTAYDTRSSSSSLPSALTQREYKAKGAPSLTGKLDYDEYCSEALQGKLSFWRSTQKRTVVDPEKHRRETQKQVWGASAGLFMAALLRLCVNFVVWKACPRTACAFEPLMFGWRWRKTR